MVDVLAGNNGQDDGPFGDGPVSSAGKSFVSRSFASRLEYMLLVGSGGLDVGREGGLPPRARETTVQGPGVELAGGLVFRLAPSCAR